MVELDVLGPVELRVGGRPMELTGRALALTVALGVDPGHPVERDTLIERVWDGQPVEVSTIDATLTRLRNRLRKVGAAPAALMSRAGTYRFQIVPEAVDWQRFRRLRSEAERARRGGDGPGALTRARAALDLWRGPPLAGLTGRWVSNIRQLMRTEHQSTVELWAQTSLATGAHDVVGELAGYAHAYPANQRITELLMLCLHAAGRSNEAVAAYHGLRRHLDEHGTSPRPETERTLRLVLGAKPSGARQPDLEPVTPLPRHQCNTLPRDLADFTGRGRDTRELTASVLTRASGATSIDVIHGLTGIGKSALAVRVAVMLRDHFPDGLLHVDLRGGGDQRPRKDPVEALRDLLSMLGVHEAQQPSTESSLAALWRDRTARSRLLVVLDNAADVAQVRPLLPGGPDCAVLITSRWRLSGLDGARWHRLSWLPDEEAAELLSAVVGSGTSSDALCGIARYCGGHPLAMRLVGGQLRGRPSWTPEDLLEKLGDVREGLGHIRLGDRSLESVFDLSIRSLDPDLRAGFSRFALHPGQVFDIHAAAALLGDSSDNAGVLLERLLEASLVEEPRPHHFSMHRLVSAFAQRNSSLSAAERRSALRRLFAYYLHACDAADRYYAPDRYRRPVRSEPDCDLPAFASLWDAYQWWDTEQQAVLDLLSWARANGGFETSEADIAHACAALLDASMRWEEAAAAHQRAVLVRGPRDPYGAAHSLYDLGQAQWRLERHDDAFASVSEAHRLWSMVGESTGAAITMNELGTIRYVQGDLRAAEGFHRQALRRAEAAGDRAGMADALNSIGNCAREMGLLHESVPPFLEALEYYGQIDNWRGIARTTGDLAGSYCYLGHHDEATRLVERARAMFRRAEDWRQAAGATANLGEIAQARGDHANALRHARSALASFRETGEREGAIVALGNIGYALVRLGRAREALAPLEEALAGTKLRLAARRYELLTVLGHAHAATNHAERASACYERAEAEAARVGTLRGRVQALLAWERLARSRGDQEEADRLRSRHEPLVRALNHEAHAAYATDMDFLHQYSQ